MKKIECENPITNTYLQTVIKFLSLERAEKKFMHEQKLFRRNKANAVYS